AGATGRDDVADRRLGFIAGRPGHLDRLAGPEAAGHRRSGWDARDLVPDPIPDARVVLLLPGSRRARRLRIGPGHGFPLHRPVPPPGLVGEPAPRAPRPRSCPRPSPSRRATSLGPDGFRRLPAMKIHWKFLVAVVVIAGGATGATLKQGTWGQIVGLWRQLSQATA